MADAKEELLEYTYGKTICQKRPEMCEPREITHVAWDADDTMWRIEPYGIATNIRGKLTLIDPDTVEVGEEYLPVTVTKSPKAPRPGKRRKRWWQQPKGDVELEEWWMKQMAPEAKEEELEEIKEELLESLPEKDRKLLEVASEITGKKVTIQPTTPIKGVPSGLARATKTDEAVYLDMVRGWNTVQAASVDKLVTQYGKGVCKVIDVREEGTIDIDCRGDIWLLTKDGFLMGETEAPPTPPTPPPTYKPTKLKITLLPTFRDTLVELGDRGITNSIISLNAPGTVKRIVEAFGFADRFIEIKDTWENKGKVFEDITRTHHINPSNAMFVDNMFGHTEEVSKKCGLVLQIGKGKDVEKPIEIFRYIKARNGSKED